MPDYAEAAEAKGWKLVGTKWVHPDHPNEYNASQIWKKYPEVRTRPPSIDWVAPKPVEPKVEAKPKKDG